MLRAATFLLLGALALGACAPAAEIEVAPADLDRAVERARADLVRRPDDAQAVRDLGGLLAQQGANEESMGLMLRAYNERPDDPKVLYYLGLLHEAEGNRDAATAFYGRYPNVTRRSPFQPLLEGRYQWLARERLRDEMQVMVAQEDSVTAGEASPRTVAVFPFTYLGHEPRFAPLGRGLGEMVTVDLAGIGAIQVVERTRLQSLLNELSLADNAAFDASTTPRAGRLLRAGRVVGGQFDVSDKTLRIDAALWNWDTDPLPDLASRSDDLDRLFDLKREVVLAIVEELGVPLSAEERDRLDEVPTHNLQAFIAYSRGLQEEDAGNFSAAAGHFRQAAKLDPGFAQAAERAKTAEAVSDAGGGVPDGLAAALALEDLGRRNLVQKRLNNLNDTVGGAFFPGGLGSRNGAPEGVTATGGLGPLPDPPAPPSSGN